MRKGSTGSVKYLLFGTGDYYNRYKKWFCRGDILALLDNAPHKQNTWIDDILVLPPEDGVKLDYDAIVILSFYYREMSEQLFNLGVPQEKVYHFFDLHALISRKEMKKPVSWFKAAESNTFRSNAGMRSLLLMTQDLELVGSTMALFHAVIAIKSDRYNITVASMMDGPLRQPLLERGIPVVVDPNLQIQTMRETEWIEAFDCILCNTINYYVYLSERNVRTPVIWWLHDPPFFYDCVRESILRKINRENLTVCAVGPLAESAIHRFLPDLPVKRLLLGIPRSGQADAREIHVEKDKIRFVTIGYIQTVKGQDILVRAVKLLPAELRKRAVFLLVGRNDSKLAAEIQEEIREMSEVQMTGALEHEAVHRQLAQADALICPSREDTMPTVCAEAMMHGVPCIVSSTVGTVEFIRDGENGFVFPSGDVFELARKLSWCILNAEMLRRAGAEARKTYENIFSMDAFRKNLTEIVDIAMNMP